jgi:hypothetical protein
MVFSRFSFPRAGVGMHSRRASVKILLLKQDAGASILHSHASAWEREKTFASKLVLNYPCLYNILVVIASVSLTVKFELPAIIASQAS